MINTTSVDWICDPHLILEIRLPNICQKEWKSASPSKAEDAVNLIGLITTSADSPPLIIIIIIILIIIANGSSTRAFHSHLQSWISSFYCSQFAQSSWLFSFRHFALANKSRHHKQAARRFSLLANKTFSAKFFLFLFHFSLKCKATLNFLLLFESAHQSCESQFSLVRESSFSIARNFHFFKQKVFLRLQMSPN